MSECIGNWFISYTGKKIDPFQMTPDDVCIEDIAHSLSHISRFNGHCAEFYCPTPDTKVLMHDLTWSSAGNIKTGDKLWGFDEHAPGGTRNIRKWRPSIAINHGSRESDLVRLVMEDGTEMVVAKDHPFLCSFKAAGNQRWETAEKIASRMQSGSTIYLPKFTEVWDSETSRESGWLAGIFDGEGTIGSVASKSGCISVAQNEGLVLDEIEKLLAGMGLSYRKSKHGSYKCKSVVLHGGMNEQMEFLGSVRPIRLLDRYTSRMSGKEFSRCKPLVKVVAAENAGNGYIVMLETSTRTYITEGFGSHNSVAQHSIYVASILPRELKFVGLMHDATEAYCGDMIRPIKVSMPTYRDLEAGIWKAICKKFDLPIELPAEVKTADNSMLMTERRDLMKITADDWGVKEAPQDFFIYPRPPRQAEANFLSFFHHWSGVS